MYRSKNVSARTRSRDEKEKCFYRNIPVLNILFYIGKGFMLRKQLTTLVRYFYNVNEHKANDMLADLLSYGLVIKKQATDTRTCIYILTKFPLAMYYESIYQLYGSLYKSYPIKDKELLHSGCPRESDFMDDYYRITADLYNHQVNFLGYRTDDDFSAYLNVKDKPGREKDIVSSPKELKRNYYSLFNMVATGFFFIGKPVNDHILIGTFDKCNNMYLKKIYENIICIFLMLERYLGFYPKLTLQVYMADADRIFSLRTSETEQGYDYSRQEKSGFTKRDRFFQNMRIPRQYWAYIQVDYVYYPLKEKYNI